MTPFEFHIVQSALFFCRVVWVAWRATIAVISVPKGRLVLLRVVHIGAFGMVVEGPPGGCGQGDVRDITSFPLVCDIVCYVLVLVL